MKTYLLSAILLLNIGCVSETQVPEIVKEEGVWQPVPFDQTLVTEAPWQDVSEFEKCTVADVLEVWKDGKVVEYKIPTWCSGDPYVFKGDPSPENEFFHVGVVEIGWRNSSPYR